MFEYIIVNSIIDPKLFFANRNKLIAKILLAQNMRKYILDEFFFRFTPSNNTPNLSSNRSDDNFFTLLKQIIHIIVKGKRLELIKMQKPESATPITSPLVVI